MTEQINKIMDMVDEIDEQIEELQKRRDSYMRYYERIIGEMGR